MLLMEAKMKHELTAIAVAILLTLAACVPAPTPTPPLPPDGLWFGVWLINDELTGWFNTTAQEQDIGAVHRNHAERLAGITAGRPQLIFASAAEAETMVPELAGKFDILGYDLEHWDATPDDEQADPIAAVKRMRELADKYDLVFALGPDRKFAAEFGVEMAPFVDIFVVQTQRLQDNPELALERNLALMQELRVANPDLEFSISIRPEDDNLGQLLALVAAFDGWIGGVGLLPSPGEEAAVMRFVELLREGE
jgi:hypothetical protein